MALLARIVKNELNRYEVDGLPEDYEVVQLPYASDSNAGIKTANDMDDLYDNVIVLPNEVRRSVLQSVIEAPENIYDDEQVPEVSYLYYFDTQITTILIVLVSKNVTGKYLKNNHSNTSKNYSIFDQHTICQ